MIAPKHRNVLPLCHSPHPDTYRTLSGTQHPTCLSAASLFILSLWVFIDTNHIRSKLLNLPSSRCSSCSPWCSLPDQLASQSWKKTHNCNVIVGEKKKANSFSDKDTDWLHNCRDRTALAPNCQQTTRGILHVDTLLTWSKVTCVICLSWGLVFHIGLLLGHSSKLTLVTCPLPAGLQTFVRAGEGCCFLPGATASVSFTNLPVHYFLHLIPDWHSALWTFVSLTFYSCTHWGWAQMTASGAHIAVDPGLRFCSIVQEVREVTHNADLVHLLKTHIVWLTGFPWTTET